MGLCQCVCLSEKAGRLSLDDDVNKQRGVQDGCSDAKLCRFRPFEQATTGCTDGKVGRDVRCGLTSNGCLSRPSPGTDADSDCSEAQCRRQQKKAMLYGLRSMRPIDDEAAVDPD